MIIKERDEEINKLEASIKQVNRKIYESSNVIQKIFMITII